MYIVSAFVLGVLIAKAHSIGYLDTPIDFAYGKLKTYFPRVFK
jgi:hypothetical protein